VSAAPRYVLSIVIATHDRREMLRRCLEALSRQTQDPESFEVIVAKDGSSDRTAEMLAELRPPFRLRALSLEKAGKPAALNAALEAVEGRACLFIDDDVIAAPQLVAEHVAAHERDPGTLGIGRLVQQAPASGDIYAQATAQRWNERYEELSEVDWVDCYGGNFSAPTEMLREVGGFAADLDAIEDLDIGFRLSRAGCTPRYLPRAEAVHADEKPGSRLLADERRYGAWCARQIERHPETSRRLTGWFDQGSIREMALRRVLLRLGIPAPALAPAGRLLPGGRPRRVWLDFVSRYALWQGVKSGMSREAWRQIAHGVPVLMYHAFTDAGERDRFILSKRAFGWQMWLLAALRYRVIGFEDLARSLRERRPLPRRAVVITIDDGYEDNLRIAYPILRRHRMTATLFLVSGRLGARSDWDEDGAATAGRRLLSVEQVREVLAGGLEVGAHTRSHPALPELPGDLAEAEIAGSREDLESMLDAPVSTFAYPYGEIDEAAVAAAERASYLGACTTDPRRARFDDDPLMIPRLEIRGSDTPWRFLRKLWLGGM
jgi:peptidoglycan/xylan/chitin deacetylase (PgdA/CDA1 family)/GT2 family glycosyltransferase